LLFFVFSIKLTCSVNVTNLPVVYYAYEQLASSTQNVNWLQLTPCYAGTASNPNMQVTLIQPDNPTFDQNTDQCFTVLEISACPDSFAQDCIIGTNYVHDGGDFSYLSNNITIPYNESLTTLSFRYQSYVLGCEITLHITYVSEEVPISNGVFDFDIFGTSNVPPITPTTFLQNVQNDQLDQVKNGQYSYYYLSFCEADINGPYVVSIIVTSDPSTPLAAFDIIGCSKEFVSLDDCTYINKNEKGVVVAQQASSITMITMDSSQVSLSEGIYVKVQGVGGEISLMNNYLLSIVATPNSLITKKNIVL